MDGAKSRRHFARLSAALLLVGACVGVGALPATRDDRHAGYYYPIPATQETYVARAETLPDANRKRRILFVTELMNQLMANPYPPPFAIFAKGEEAEKLIITSLHADGYNTLYRLRGLLAILSSRARGTPIFQQYEVEDVFTFFDLLKLLGFRRLTVTDGDRLAHQITIE